VDNSPLPVQTADRSNSSGARVPSFIEKEIYELTGLENSQLNPAFVEYNTVASHLVFSNRIKNVDMG
jgi:hypothetical protein